MNIWQEKLICSLFHQEILKIRKSAEFSAEMIEKVSNFLLTKSISVQNCDFACEWDTNFFKTLTFHIGKKTPNLAD